MSLCSHPHDAHFPWWLLQRGDVDRRNREPSRRSDGRADGAWTHDRFGAAGDDDDDYFGYGGGGGGVNYSGGAAAVDTYKPRAPVMTSTKLMVTGLDPEITEEDLLGIFQSEAPGDIRSCKLMLDDNGVSKVAPSPSLHMGCCCWRLADHINILCVLFGVYRAWVLLCTRGAQLRTRPSRSWTVHFH